jgi:glycosyltransferase involved in cell wall biosynthesis
MSIPVVKEEISPILPESFKILRSEPARVLFMIDNLGYAGTEQWLLRLINGFDQTCVLPFLCLLDGESELSRSLEPKNVPILRLGVKKLRSLQAPKAAGLFLHFLKRNKMDVVQLHFPDSTHFGAPLAWLAGVKRIIGTSRNSGHWLSDKEKARFHFTSRFLTDLVSNSRVSQAVAATFMKVPLKRSVIIPAGINLNRFDHITHLTPMRPLSRTLRVGMVANLRKVKNIQILVKAAAEVVAQLPNVQFVVVGEGPERKPLESLIASLNLESCFQLMGNREDVPEFLQTIDIAVLTSLSEGCSNALLEYMAAARPVVASAIPANQEVIQDGKNGILFDTHDHLALAKAIIKLAEDPEFSAELGVIARQDMHNRTMANEYTAYEQLYRW